MKKFESSIDHHLAEGEKLMENKLYDRSMIEFSKAMSIDSKVATKVLDEIFQRCIAEGSYEGVVAVGSNLLVKNPENIEMANAIGNAYRKSGDFAQAKKLYEHCLKYDPKDKNSAYNLAATYARSDLYDSSIVRAISEFESLTGFMTSDNTEGEKKLQEIQKKILEEKAAKESNDGETASEKTDDSKDGHEELKSKDKAKKKKESKVDLVPLEIFKYLRSNVDFESEEGVLLLLSLGYYCLAKGISDIAWRALTRVSFSNPDDETVLSFLAVAQASKKGKVDYDKLIVFLGKHPFNRYAHVNLGYMYLKNNNKLLARKYFILTKRLLDKSEGYYSMSEYRAVGDRHYKEESYLKALKIFNVIVSENETVELLTVISKIHIKIENYKEAIVTLNRITEFSPDNEKVKKTLKELDQTFLYQADKLREERKFAKSLEFLEFSGKVKRTSALIEKMITVCNLLKDEKKLLLLNEELIYIKKQEFEEEKERGRQEKIEEGLQFEKKQPNKAIESYESAFRLKADKEVFLRLAKLYERTKQKDQIEDLTQRFNKMIEHEKRMTQYEQDLLRSKRAKADREENKDENETDETNDTNEA